jgi:hypothetical protein
VANQIIAVLVAVLTCCFVYRATVTTRVLISGLGLLATVGLTPTVFAWLGATIDWYVPVITGVLGLILTVLAQRTSMLREQDIVFERTILKPPRILAVLPGLFMVGSSLNILMLLPNGPSYLLNTWDGSSNSGLVRGLEVNPSLQKSVALLTQWESYPNFAHLFTAVISRAVQAIAGDDPRTTATIFALAASAIYTVLILVTGLLATALSREVSASPQIPRIVGVLSQAIFFLPKMINDLLLMHSISFMTALVTVLAALLLTIRTNAEQNLRFPALVVCGWAAILVSGTYPLLNLFPLVLWFFNLFRYRKYLTVIQLAFGSVLLALGLSLTLNALVASNTASRFESTGHIYPLPAWVPVALIFGGVVGIIVARTRQIRALTALLLVPTTGLFQYLWLQAPSRSRAYGLNYYAKKFEYGVLVLLWPVVVGILVTVMGGLADRYLFSVWRKLAVVRNVPRRSMAIAGLAASLLLCGASLFDNLVKPAQLDDSAKAEFAASMEEATRPGPGLVWNRANRAGSITPSLMANYLDASLWREPFLEDRNLRIFQSAQGAGLADAPARMCEVIQTQGVEGVITYLNPTERRNCVDVIPK